MRSTATVMFLCLSLTILLLSGCGSTASSRVEAIRAAAFTYSQQADDAEADLLSLRQTLSELEALRDEAQATGDNETITKVLTAIVGTQKKIDQAVAIKAEADRVVALLNAKIEEIQADGEVDVSEELELYSGQVKEVSGLLPSPLNYAGYGLSGILAVAASVFRRREKKVSDAASQIVTGVNEIIGNISNINTPEEAKAILKEKQSPTTRALVDTIKASQ